MVVRELVCPSSDRRKKKGSTWHPFHGVPRGIFKFEIFTSSWNPVMSASDTVKYTGCPHLDIRPPILSWWFVSENGPL